MLKASLSEDIVIILIVQMGKRLVKHQITNQPESTSSLSCLRRLG